MAGRDGRDRFCLPDGTIGKGFDGRTGWYALVLMTGRDGRSRFRRRDRTVGAAIVDGTGR